ncbi:MAG: lysozyme [Smithella sp.]
MKATDNCVQLIKRFEGLYLKAYVCPAGVLTIGYGHTRGVKPGDEINELQAEIYLREDVEACEIQLNYLTLPINQHQFDALCSFIFNLGIGNFMQSTLLKKLKAGDKTAADEILRWDKSGGKVLPGLTARRKAEYDLFCT